jgi:hypothetical protein
MTYQETVEKTRLMVSKPAIKMIAQIKGYKYERPVKAKRVIKHLQQPKTEGVTQAQVFVQGRSVWIQYFIDVFALAFLVSITLRVL